jgi:hypothetical protein
MAKTDRVNGDHNTFQAGSMMVKFYQTNYHHVKGTWTGESDDDYTEFEEIKDDPRNKKKEEPNYFQTGRFLKRVCYGDWFLLMRTDKRYTENWISKLIDALMLTAWKEQLAEMWEDKDRRELLKGYVIGCLKDAGVIEGSYDAIARSMGYDKKDRKLSRYMSDGKKQGFHDWMVDYVIQGKA